MILPSISIEQNEILQELNNNNNVVVDSVAGSGKTTCNLHIASFFKQCNILLLTYNAKLKKETRERVELLGLTNLETHSYHSFCVKYYDTTCFTDSSIISILKTKTENYKSFKYDIIILDEAQDISALYYELVCKIYKDNNNDETTKLCILGDKFQSIFDFNKADQRFITFAPEIFTFNNLLWKKCNLTTSFRITREMSLFINNCMLKDNRIVSNKITQIKPRYIICDCFGNKVFEEVKYYLELGYKPQEIFILAPSVKSHNSPVRLLENKIKTDLNIPIYVPTSDDGKLDSEVLEGKLVFSTFHQSKGLERKVIIVFSFDNSYFEYYKKDKNPFVCPNELYVATTRSLEHLTLLHHYKNDYLPFLCKDKMNLYCNIVNDKIMQLETNTNKKPLQTSPTDIIKHLPQDVIDKCLNYVEIETIQEPKEIINIPLKTKQDYGNGINGSESVCEITGIAIPIYFEYKTKGTMDILKQIPYKQHKNHNTNCLIQLEAEDCDEDTEDDILLNNISFDSITPSKLLYIANLWNSIKTGFLFKKIQITNYDWLSKDNLDKCVERIEKLNISKHALFEYKCELKNEKELLNREIKGFVDCVDKNNLYEFKCVQKLEKEHILQLVIYMYLNEKTKEKKIIYMNKNTNNTQHELIKNYELKLKQYQEQLKTEYNVGDIIKYNKFDYEERGTIIKIYKNGKILIEDTNKRRNDIVKHSITTIITKSKKSNAIEQKIVNIKNKIVELQVIIPSIELPKNTNYYLYNILTDELIQIKSSLENLIQIIEYLFYSKYISSNETTDNTFLTHVIQIKKEYFIEEK